MYTVRRNSASSHQGKDMGPLLAALGNCRLSCSGTPDDRREKSRRKICQRRGARRGAPRHAGLRPCSAPCPSHRSQEAGQRERDPDRPRRPCGSEEERIQPMIRFAFEGRCSTEDQQDPESSRAWQKTRAKALIEPHGGKIVAEYFDAGQSRAVPWQRRPRANDLLQALKDPNRGFEAV